MGANYNNHGASCCSRFCFRLWSRVVALFQMPTYSRRAISLVVSVVFRRKRAASSNFCGTLRFLIVEYVFPAVPTAHDACHAVAEADADGQSRRDTRCAVGAASPPA